MGFKISVKLVNSDPAKKGIHSKDSNLSLNLNILDPATYYINTGLPDYEYLKRVGISTEEAYKLVTDPVLIISKELREGVRKKVKVATKLKEAPYLNSSKNLHILWRGITYSLPLVFLEYASMVRENKQYLDSLGLFEEYVEQALRSLSTALEDINIKNAGDNILVFETSKVIDGRFTGALYTILEVLTSILRVLEEAARISYPPSLADLEKFVKETLREYSLPHADYFIGREIEEAGAIIYKALKYNILEEGRWYLYDDLRRKTTGGVEEDYIGWIEREKANIKVRYRDISKLSPSDRNLLAHMGLTYDNTKLCYDC